MSSFQKRLRFVYAFLSVVALYSVEHIWSLQTNPFVGYLGGARWFYLALDIAAIFSAVHAARLLARRAADGPRTVIVIALVVLVAYLGTKVQLFMLQSTVPFHHILGVWPALAISILAIVAIALIKSKPFADEYPKTR